MKKENLLRLVFVSGAIVISIMLLMECGRGFASYYDKPASETPVWFWLLFD